MNKFVLRQSLLLLLTATIWGVAFVAQSVGMDYVGPFTFNVMRSIIGGVVLLPCIALLGKINGKGNTEAAKKWMAKSGRHFSLAVLPAVCFSVLQVICSSLGSCIHLSEKQDLSQQCTLWLFRYLGFFWKKVSGKVWCGVGIAVAGLYLLCMTESGFSVQKGDFLLMLCALAFSLHILVIDYFSPKADGVKLSCIQFFTCGILSGVGMVLTEKPQLTSILAAWMPILYAGVMSCGVAYTLQIIGQKGMNPTVASLILSLESVVSVIAGFLILHQTLSLRELIGCVLMFAAIILVQLPDRKK